MKKDNFDIPIFLKSYELYKLLHGFQNSVAKQERFTLWQKCENTTLTILEWLILASQTVGNERLVILGKVSAKVDIIRVFVRLAHDIKIIDSKKYVALQKTIDEIGRMLGGWIKSLKQKTDT